MTGMFASRALLIATLVYSLASCALPDLKPFADSTAELNAAVVKTNSAVQLTLIEADAPAQAEKFAEEMSVRVTAMSAMVAYSDALESIAEAGRKGSDSAGNVANALDGLLGSLSAPTMPTNYVAMAKSLYGAVASVRATRSFAKAVQAADPAIQGVASILAQDFEDIEKILRLARGEVVQQLQDKHKELINYREQLNKERRSLEDKMTGALAQGNVDPNTAKQLAKVNQLIEDTRDRYEPLMEQVEGIKRRISIEVEVVVKAKTAVMIWADVHSSLATAAKEGLQPNTRLLVTTVIELRDLIEKERGK